MKRITFTVFAVFAYLTVFGQAEGVKKDTTVVIDTDPHRVATNRFWSNWFFGAGAGAQVYFGDHNRQMKFSELLTPNFGVYVGKWFTPGIGLRAGVNGFKIKGLTQNGSHSTGERYDGKPWEGYWLEKQEFNYLHVHADVLFNLSNILGGYKADRFYNISPYVGLGWMVTNDEPKQREVSANLGIYNTFRLSNAFNLTLDVRGGMVNDRFDGETGNRKNEGPLSAQIGFVYKFPKTDWNRNQTTIISYDEEELRILRRKVNELAQSNELLHKQLADSKHETVTDVILKNKLLAAPLLITFPINSSKVTNEARVNLGFFAKAINDNSNDVVYNVTGYADQGTGSPSTNERLSKERAQAIRDLLVNEFGVESRQIKISAAGGIENMHYNDPRLSRAVITYIE